MHAHNLTLSDGRYRTVDELAERAACRMVLLETVAELIDHPAVERGRRTIRQAIDGLARSRKAVR